MALVAAPVSAQSLDANLLPPGALKVDSKPLKNQLVLGKSLLLRAALTRVYNPYTPVAGETLLEEVVCQRRWSCVYVSNCR